jgi:hypothetical protein
VCVPVLSANIESSVKEHEQEKLDGLRSAQITKNMLNTFVKSGWEVEKMTSSGKFLARKLSLDATKTMISWPSNSKRRSIEGTIGNTTPTHVIRVQEITSVLGGLPAGTLGTAGRCVTIQTKAAPFSFRFDSPEDASVFISCVKELMPGN